MQVYETMKGVTEVIVWSGVLYAIDQAYHLRQAHIFRKQRDDGYVARNEPAIARRFKDIRIGWLAGVSFLVLINLAFGGGGMSFIRGLWLFGISTVVFGTRQIWFNVWDINGKGHATERATNWVRVTAQQPENLSGHGTSEEVSAARVPGMVDQDALRVKHGR